MLLGLLVLAIVGGLLWILFSSVSQSVNRVLHAIQEDECPYRNLEEDDTTN